MHDPLAGSSWSTPSTVAGFVEVRGPTPPCCALPRPSWIARPPGSRSTSAAAPAATPCPSRARAGACSAPISRGRCCRRPATACAPKGVRLSLAHAPMDALPVRAGSCDLVVAHGIWNLARSMAELRACDRRSPHGSRRPARRCSCSRFRATRCRPTPLPVPGEPFIYTQFSGQRQCFLTREQLTDELATPGSCPMTSSPSPSTTCRRRMPSMRCARR